ncbi:MAG: isoprenyl transferase [Rhodospirillaceae bacterium]
MTHSEALPAPTDPCGGSAIVPFHVAIIMDGNGRWAKARGLPRVAGHQRGVEAVRTVVKAAADLGVTHLTLFGFSSENWRRPETEVSALMGLLRLYLRNEVNKLHKDGIRLRFIGDRARLPGDIVTLMTQAEDLTAGNSALCLTVALSYGGRADIVGAARRLAHAVAEGVLDPDAIDEAALDGALSTAGLPEPDLLIRTSGEQRVSNFLLWQCAYAEMVFVDTLWPDFGAGELAWCVTQFQGRERRFGAVTS